MKKTLNLKYVFVTYFNSDLDIDYKQPEYISPLVVFYTNSPPKKIKASTFKIINVKDVDLIKNESSFVQSRYVKFFPSKLIGSKYTRFIYFDYRIKLSKSFTEFIKNTEQISFLPHREGGKLREEVIRNITRNRIDLDQLTKYLYKYDLDLSLPITENGIYITSTEMISNLSFILPLLKECNRDQLITPLMVSNPEYFPFSLNSRYYFLVRPKSLSILNFLKLAIRENIPLFVWNRTKS